MQKSVIQMKECLSTDLSKREEKRGGKVSREEEKGKGKGEGRSNRERGRRGEREGRVPKN